MKKLMSFLAVAAIVTSAFAFTFKKSDRFCAAPSRNGACNFVIGKIDPTGTTYYIDDTFTPVVASDCDNADCVVETKIKND